MVEVAAIRIAQWGVCAVKDETFFSMIGGKLDKELQDLMGRKSVVVLKCMINSNCVVHSTKTKTNKRWTRCYECTLNCSLSILN